MIRGLVALVLAAGTLGATPQAPPDVSATLTVRLAADKSTYALGELIPLELEFRGRAGPDWNFNTMGDGLWREPERYVVTPAGGHDDPFAEYFSSVGIVGGVLSGWHPLDGTPFVVRTRLNDRVRFTKPGDYWLVVESSRLERYSRKPAPALVSNPVALHVRAASPRWAAAELARAVAAVEGGRVEEGAAVLRHLGTKGAAIARKRFAPPSRCRSARTRRKRAGRSFVGSGAAIPRRQTASPTPAGPIVAGRPRDRGRDASRRAFHNSRSDPDGQRGREGLADLTRRREVELLEHP